MVFFISGTWNAWSRLEGMPFDTETGKFQFAVPVGDTHIESFRINCGGYADNDLFPACPRAGPSARILGPGKAPQGHEWVPD